MAPHGHHNIAWEISNDHRFLKEVGSIDDLLTEIAELPHDVILSSEDFECSAHHSEQFRSFIEHLRQRQFDVKFIIYLRNQIEYAESLYLMMSLFGLGTAFREYLDEILESGKFCWVTWIFQFNYDEFLSRLQSIDGVELAVRSYDAVKKGALLGDLLSILGPRVDNLAIVDEIRLNERSSTFAAIEAFYQTLVGRSLHPSEQAALAALYRSESIHVGMSDQSKLNLIDKFDGSNRRVSSTYEESMPFLVEIG